MPVRGVDMNTNRIGLLAWVILALIGFLQIVDIAGIPIIICARCGAVLNLVLGVILIAVSAAAFLTNRAAAGPQLR
jgi:hypothetical protein